MEKINIAIDGYSSCGKSTLAKWLAKEVGYTYIDSGAMYRAVALFAKRNAIITDTGIDEEKLRKVIATIDISFKSYKNGGQETFLNGENVEKEIRSLEISSYTSRISAIGFVREEMVRQQQAMGKNKGVVMDGRDIGTVVLPNSELKIFVTASSEVRAQRRFDELIQKGEQASYKDVYNNLKERDLRDTTRKEAPLRKADDAIVLDNSNMTINEQSQKALEMYHAYYK